MWPNRRVLAESRVPPRSAASTISLSPPPHATPQRAGPLHAYPRPIRPAPACARTPTTPDRAAPHKPWGKFVRIARSVRRVHVAFETPAVFHSAGVALLVLGREA